MVEGKFHGDVVLAEVGWLNLGIVFSATEWAFDTIFLKVDEFKTGLAVGVAAIEILCDSFLRVDLAAHIALHRWGIYKNNRVFIL